MVKVCECCGHPLPEIDATRGMTKQQNVVFFAVYDAGKRGLTMQQLIDKVYGHDPSGGPEFAAASLRCQLSKMKHLLKPHGMRIKIASGGIRTLEAL